ncbi:hypothetical protein NQZ79_g717 [Umbelopsis isabellina]|nr:hypothetical protein NQZ79_g717 [Umbelopsis isabellina]
MEGNKGQQLPALTKVSFIIARHLDSENLYTQYLTPSESQIFKDAVANFDKWSSFIKVANKIGTTEVDQNDEQKSVSNQMSDEQVAAFRVRAMIFDQLVPQLYQCSKPCCKMSNGIDDILRDLSNNKYDALIEQSSALTEEPSPKMQSTQKSDAEKTPNNHVEASETNGDPDAQQVDGEATGDALISPLELAHIPLTNVYHTFETDLAAMIEQRKLEEYEAQEEMNDKENQSEKTISILNANSNFSLKYLLEAIEQNRAVTKLGDRELRNLLTDVRPHRSKWANEEKLGQEELYESCEKVLMDLKNYTEHSTPFLNKVNKREAPDYYDVIKKPMDLGLVTKKLKACQYKSKKEFADDLYLIYENCLVYNTNPQASEYRKHAIAMRKKTDKLLQQVPDVSIRDRSEYDAEEEAEESDDHEEDDHKASRKAPGASKHLANKTVQAKHANDAVVSTPSDATREPSLAPSNDDSQADHDMDGNGNGNGTGQIGMKGLSGQSNSDNAIDREQEERNINAEIEANMGMIQDEIWRELTKKTRAKVSSDADKQSKIPFGERPVITRSAVDMKRFSMIEQAHNHPETVRKIITASNDGIVRWIEQGNTGLYDDCDSDDDDSFDDGFLSRRMAKSNTAQVDDSSRADLYLPEYAITSGIPEIIAIPEEISDKTRRGSIDGLENELEYGLSDVSLDRYPTVAIPNHGTSEMIDHNLHTLREIRRVYAKCVAVRNDVPIAALNTSQAYQDDSQVGENDIASPSTTEPTMAATVGESKEAIHDAEDNEPARHLHRQSEEEQELVPLIINQESGQALMQRTVVKLIEHAGFEGSQTSALAVLSDVATNYFMSLGKTLRVYWDGYCNNMTDEEILTHTLYDNGIEAIQELEEYITDDIEKYGHRLNDIHRKLTSSYNELVNGSTDVQLPDDSFFQSEDAFINGALGDDIGEDFFGFKNLGLDKELNLDRINIPSRLWYGKDKAKDHVIGPKSNEPVLEFPPPPAFLRTEGNLVEDEYQTTRRSKPRYPPILSKAGGLNRKRPLKDANGELKKAKKKKPMEIIQAERAEKRKLKQEARAQKVAEREQKKKMREELKERDRLAKLEAKREKKAMAKKGGSSVATANSHDTPSVTGADETSPLPLDSEDQDWS